MITDVNTNQCNIWCAARAVIEHKARETHAAFTFEDRLTRTTAGAHAAAATAAADRLNSNDN